MLPLYALALLHEQQNGTHAGAAGVRPIAYVSLASKYVRAMVLKRLRERGYECVTSERKRDAHVQFAEYERIEWDTVIPGDARANAYCVRRGLTRKAALAQIVSKWVEKMGADKTVLATSVPLSLAISTWEARDTDASWLAKNFGVHDSSLALNECLWEAESLMEAHPGETWVLKPSISSKGAQVTVVRTKDDLRSVVNEWSDVREWVLQRYVPRLLLLKEQRRKFHLRVFVVCVGALKVFLLTKYIAFFATESFGGGGGGSGAQAQEEDFTHITNAAHQKNHPEFIEEDCFLSSDELAELVQLEPARGGLGMSKEDAEREFTTPEGRVLRGMATCLDEVFRAAERQPAVFQPLGNCFELYGLDFLLDEDLAVHLLEFNSGPDLEQAGDRLKGVIETLMDGVFELGVDGSANSAGFVKIHDVQLAQVKGVIRSPPDYSG